MAKKTARKPRPDADGPARKIESKPDRLSHPLLTEPAIHADLKPLFNALVKVSAQSVAVARSYSDLLALKESRGLPTREEHPDSPSLEREGARHAEWVKAELAASAENGGNAAIGGFLEPSWTELIRDWTRDYPEWCTAIAEAREQVKSSAAAKIMDAGEPRILHRWTTQATMDLDGLVGALHPARIGQDGMGIIRCGVPPLPASFRTRAESVEKRISELRAAPALAGDGDGDHSLPPRRLRQCETL